MPINRGVICGEFAALNTSYVIVRTSFAPMYHPNQPVLFNCDPSHRRKVRRIIIISVLELYSVADLLSLRRRAPRWGGSADGGAARGSAVLLFDAHRCPSVPFVSLRFPSLPFGVLRCLFASLRCPSLPFGALSLLFASHRFSPLPFASLRLPSLPCRVPSLPFASLRFRSVPFRFPSPLFASLQCPSGPFDSLRFDSVPFGSIRFPSVIFGILSLPFAFLRFPSRLPFSRRVGVTSRGALRETQAQVLRPVQCAT